MKAFPQVGCSLNELFSTCWMLGGDDCECFSTSFNLLLLLLAGADVAISDVLRPKSTIPHPALRLRRGYRSCPRPPLVGTRLSRIHRAPCSTPLYLSNAAVNADWIHSNPQRMCPTRFRHFGPNPQPTPNLTNISPRTRVLETMFHVHVSRVPAFLTFKAKHERGRGHVRRCMKDIRPDRQNQEKVK